MAYFITVMTVDVYERFSASPRDKIGFPLHHRPAIHQLEVGDKLICYISGIMRWTGVLEVTSKGSEERGSLVYDDLDIVTLRFQIEPLVWLPVERAIPIKEERVWTKLSFTMQVTDTSWIGRFRTSLTALDAADGLFMERLLTNLNENVELFAYDEKIYRRHLRLSRSSYRQKITKDEEGINTQNQVVTPLRRVTRKRQEEGVDKPKGRQAGVKRGPKPKTDKMPEATHKNPLLTDNSVAEVAATLTPVPQNTVLTTHTTEDVMTHYVVLAKIGVAMGMQIWSPLGNRSALKKQSELPVEYFLEHFPVFFDNTINHYLESTPLIWAKGRMLLRAFSVFDNAENLYGSLIHYADLFVLQPNLLMKTHLVSANKNKAILTDIVQRPLFAQMTGLPLQRRCQFLAAETLQDLLKDKHLPFLSDSVIDQ